MYMGQFSSLKVLHENMTSSFHCNPIPNKQTNIVIYIALNANYLQQLKKKIDYWI